MQKACVVSFTNVNITSSLCSSMNWVNNICSNGIYKFSCMFNLQSTIQFTNSHLTLVHTFSMHHTTCVNNNMDCMSFFVLFVFSGCSLTLNQYSKWLQNSYAFCACVLGPMSESNPRPCLICIIYKQPIV